MRVEEDTVAHDSLIDQWQSMGVPDRIIRSHRRPKRSSSNIGIVMTAVTLATGIAVISVSIAPNHAASSTSSTFVSPQVDDQLLERSIVDANPPASRNRDDTQPPVTRPTIKRLSTHWVNATVKISVTSCYGSRWGTTHRGIDFDGETGDKIRSVGDGVVVQAGWRYSGYGYSVVVAYPSGWMVLYGHMSKVTVRTGQRVHAGTQVGLMGSTGHSTGSHLHLGVAKTSSLSKIFVSFIDPASWLHSHKLSAGRCT